MSNNARIFEQASLKLKFRPPSSQRIVLAFPRRPGDRGICSEPGKVGKADVLGPPHRHLTVVHGGEAARPEVVGLHVARIAINGIAAD